MIIYDTGHFSSSCKTSIGSGNHSCEIPKDIKDRSIQVEFFSLN